MGLKVKKIKIDIVSKLATNRQRTIEKQLTFLGILIKGHGSKLYEKLVPKTYQKSTQKSRRKSGKKLHHKPKSANVQDGMKEP